MRELVEQRGQARRRPCGGDRGMKYRATPDHNNATFTGPHGVVGGFDDKILDDPDADVQAVGHYGLGYLKEWLTLVEYAYSAGVRGSTDGLTISLYSVTKSLDGSDGDVLVATAQTEDASDMLPAVAGRIVPEHPKEDSA